VTRVPAVLLAVAVVMAVPGPQAAGAATPKGDAAATPSAKNVTRTVRALKKRYPLRSVIFGVWVNGRRLATGALGESRKGVRATKADHFRIGNVTESFTTTLLLQLVDQGRLRLEDPLSKWFPAFPNASRVTLGMLARSTAGYADYVTTPAFVSANDANPARRWKVTELLNLAFSRPPLFPPGTSWAFSDTNFVLLGEVLRRATGQSLPQLLRRRILNRLGLRQTAMQRGSRIPKPVMHGYSSERGRYEDTIKWSPSWAKHAGTMTSTLGDLGRWARALGSGRLLSRRSHALQIGRSADGLSQSPRGFYSMGSVNSNGWTYNNPQLMGYNGVVSYLKSRKIAVVVFVTQGRRGNPAVGYASAIYNRLGKLLVPSQPPRLAVCPRPPC
jgi:D-alanyl-D-alanine carboxypeptidase